MFLEEHCGALVQIQQLSAQLRLFGLGRGAGRLLGKRDAKFFGDDFDRFRKSYVVDFLHEAEDVAGSAASEAVEELAGGVDGKRRRLLLMEGTKSRKILRPGFFQLHVVADEADDIGLLLDGFRE